MDTKRLLGPPIVAWILAAGLVVAALIILGTASGIERIFLVVLTALLIWRSLSLSVELDGDELVVTNLLKTYRFDVDAIEVEPRVVDPPVELTDPDFEIETRPDDNTRRAAKRYVLKHGESLHYIDSLMGRSKKNHERLAWELRQEIKAARKSP